MRFPVTSAVRSLSNIRLIVLFGKPGSGKTYLSTRLAKVIGFSRVSTDETRHYLFPRVSFSEAETQALWLFLYERIRATVAAGNGVVVDGNVGRVRYREALLAHCLGGDSRTYVAIYVDCDEEVALERIRHRPWSLNPFGCDRESFEEIKAEIEFWDQETLIGFDNTSQNDHEFKIAFSSLLHDLELWDAKAR